MALKMTASDVKEVCKGIWALTMPPHQIRLFGNSPSSVGTQSILIFSACQYDDKTKQLHFEIGDVTPINIGTTSRVIGIAANPNINDVLPHLDEKSQDLETLAPGDLEFIRLAKLELSDDMAEVAKKLLTAVRQKSPGELKRGQSRNFSETPDNFWYVIVQPRVDELSITVRGPVSHFKGVTDLEIKDDRGNTRFKIRGDKDVQNALKLIFHAIRKR